MDQKLEDLTQKIDETLASLRARDDLNIDNQDIIGGNLFKYSYHYNPISRYNLCFNMVLKLQITLGTRHAKWNSEVITNSRLDRNEERFRQRFEDQMNQQRYVNEREFGGRWLERYCVFNLY